MRTRKDVLLDWAHRVRTIFQAEVKQTLKHNVPKIFWELFGALVYAHFFINVFYTPLQPVCVPLTCRDAILGCFCIFSLFGDVDKIFKGRVFINSDHPCNGKLNCILGWFVQWSLSAVQWTFSALDLILATELQRNSLCCRGLSTEWPHCSPG